MNEVIITEIEFPKYFSFWRFERGSKCSFAALSGGIKTNLKIESEKYSKSQILGLLYHFLEKSFYENEFRLSDYDSFLETLNRFQVKYDSFFEFRDYKNLDEWSGVTALYDSFLETAASTLFRGVKNSSYYEKTLSSAKYLISGDLDLIQEGDDCVDIWEFKSGSLYEENNVLKISYVRQLHFYAVLAEEFFNKHVSRLFLKSPAGGKVEVLFDNGLVKLLKNQVKVLRTELALCENLSPEEINNRLASPSIKCCQYCNIKYLCNSFLKEQESYITEHHIFTATGTVSIKGGSFKSYNTFSVSTKNGKIDISNIPLSLCKAFKESTVYAFLGLQREFSHHYVFGRFSKVIVYVDR